MSDAIFCVCYMSHDNQLPLCRVLLWMIRIKTTKLLGSWLKGEDIGCYWSILIQKILQRFGIGGTSLVQYFFHNCVLKSNQPTYPFCWPMKECWWYQGTGSVLLWCKLWLKGYMSCNIFLYITLTFFKQLHRKKVLLCFLGSLAWPAYLELNTVLSNQG